MYNWKAIDEKKAKLDKLRPFPQNTLKSLQEKIALEWTYHSNAIEGNTLTLRETKVVLEGVTIGGKSVKEHLEAINHKEAILYLNKDFFIMDRCRCYFPICVCNIVILCNKV